ncbi:HTH_Tnp_Tc3_2 domain-containing protein [Trichonephila clavipes]|nr:HTH_Tnp_Tc3_2 domain-containing protein [Trichonephila clavipes]
MLDLLRLYFQCVASLKTAALSGAIQAKVATSLSSRTIRRCLAEIHLGKKTPITLFPPLTPAHRRLHLGGAAHEEFGLQQNGNRASSATNPDSISAVMTIVLVCGDPVVDTSQSLPFAFTTIILNNAVLG